jgi:hypothetical protein
MRGSVFKHAILKEAITLKNQSSQSRGDRGREVVQIDFLRSNRGIGSRYR